MYSSEKYHGSGTALPQLAGDQNYVDDSLYHIFLPLGGQTLMTGQLVPPTAAATIPPTVKYPRQNNPTNGNQGAGNPGNANTNNGNANTNTNNGNGNTNTNNGNANGNQNQTSSTSSTLSIPSTAPPGGLLITQPAQTSAASFFKIAPDEIVTFGWNFTSLFITPDTLFVSAFCSANGNTYPVGPGTLDGSATQVEWDIGSYQQANPTQPLIVASYTLQIFDAHGLGVIPAAGRFEPNADLNFALYVPQSYTPLSDGWQCPACSSGTPIANARPMAFAILATFLAMVFGGWGVMRRR